jgi:hypothetical protein
MDEISPNGAASWLGGGVSAGSTHRFLNLLERLDSTRRSDSGRLTQDWSITMEPLDLTKRDMTVLYGGRTFTLRAFRHEGAWHGTIIENRMPVPHQLGATADAATSFATAVGLLAAVVDAGVATAEEDEGTGSAALITTLRTVARAGRSISEHAIAPLAGIDEIELGRVLDAINRTEDAAGRPMLAAVVVGASGLPGPAFFTSARDLGLDVGSDDRIVWERELQRVHSYWAYH